MDDKMDDKTVVEIRTIFDTMQNEFKVFNLGDNWIKITGQQIVIQDMKDGEEVTVTASDLFRILAVNEEMKLENEVGK